jgi:2-polyprenyl-6-hydroxyphenyl methylase/3-demethylubiquinone-9 3-methyltransferase
MNDLQHAWKSEVDTGSRFKFGKNWAAFLHRLTPQRIETAENALKRMLGVDRLDGKTFIDIGSGSGLSSLAARNLGARVTSFDFDPQSVACTAELKRRYHPNDVDWTVSQGSILDAAFVSSLGAFDVVYSWGVLHHTGRLWDAVENTISLVPPGGTLFLSIYNDQGRASRFWKRVKQSYVRAPGALKWAILLPVFIRQWGPSLVRDSIKGRPLKTWRNYGERGMDPWRDVVDWAGGYPFEVARPEEVFDVARRRGFDLVKLKTCAGGHGCNEFVFVRRSETT